MTNAQIIFNASQDLAKEGKIGYTGREFKMTTADGGEIIVKETEPIHTFAAWKQAGYAVRKGEKAIAKIVIWKYREKVGDDGEVEDAKMFMKTAAFFKGSQVEKIA